VLNSAYGVWFEFEILILNPVTTFIVFVNLQKNRKNAKCLLKLF